MFPSGVTVDSAIVVIVARVRPDGSPESITVVSEPKEGFGAAARACAMRQRYAPAEDRSGHVIASSTAPFRVRFTR
jgi:protein TonB